MTITIREWGDFTSTVKEVRPGERAYLDGPYGAFSVDRHRSLGYVLIAGGVALGGEVRLDDRNGHRINKQGYDPAPYVGLRFAGGF